MNDAEWQEIFDMQSDHERSVRSKYHLTLGKLIEILDLYPDFTIEMQAPHSYRGYYSDLSFEPSHAIEASDLSKILKNNILNQKLEGYKGGEYLMDEDTPLWLDYYGEYTGTAIVRIIPVFGSLVIETRVVA